MIMRKCTSRLVAVLKLVVAGGAAVVLAWSAPASASCAPPTDIPTAIDQSDIVVVGHVTATRSQDRIATVQVEERWKGDVDRTFEVFGGPAEDGMATSVDRTYEVGGRYLLFVREPGAHGETATFGGDYEDSGCSTTQAWSEALAQYRPSDATMLSGGADTRQPATSDAPLPRRAPDRRWLLAVIIVSGSVVSIAVISRRPR